MGFILFFFAIFLIIRAIMTYRKNNSIKFFDINLGSQEIIINHTCLEHFFYRKGILTNEIYYNKTFNEININLEKDTVEEKDWIDIETTFDIIKRKLNVFSYVLNKTKYTIDIIFDANYTITIINNF